MQSPKHRTVRKLMLLLQLSHSGSGLVLFRQHGILFRGETVFANHDLLADQQPEQGGWGNVEILGDRRGTLTLLVTADYDRNAIATETGFESMVLEHRWLSRRLGVALDRRQLADSLRGQSDANLVGQEVDYVSSECVYLTALASRAISPICDYRRR